MEKKIFNTGLGLTIAVIQRMEAKKDNELFTNSLKKLVNMNPRELKKFLGKDFFWSLRKISDIFLSQKESPALKIKTFFKTKEEGGIFAHVDKNILTWFKDQVESSTIIGLSSYEVTKNVYEEDIIYDSKTGKFYGEFNFSQIKSVCERHIINKEDIFTENGTANIFFVKNKSKELCRVNIHLNDDGWYVDVRKYSPSHIWCAGRRFFFFN
jgi:hypothetical protein